MSGSPHFISRIGAVVLARKRDCGRVRSLGQTRRRLSGLRPGSVRRARYLRRVEHDKRLALKIAVLAATFRAAGRRYVDRPACVVSAIDEMSALGVVDIAASVSAAQSAGGNTRPRLSARRRIPAQALRLKKNRRSTCPVSKICQNEDATPPLRNSEPLRIQHAPLNEPVRAKSSSGVPPPPPRYVEVDPNHFSNHASKVASAVFGEYAWDVFPECPSGAASLAGPSNNSHCIEK